MSNRKNFFDSFSRIQPEKTPYQISFTLPAYQKMQVYYNTPHFMDRINNCIEYIDFRTWQYDTEVEPGVWQDVYGVRWNKNIDPDIGIVCNQVINENNIDSYSFPDPFKLNYFDKIDLRINDAIKRDKVVVASLGFSLFERAWTMYGMENLLCAMKVDPEFTDLLFDKILEYNLSIIDEACLHNIDGFYFGDDWGMQKGLIMGPDAWDRFILPRIRKMYGRVKKAGKFVMIHSCGQVDSLFPKLIDAGLDIFNPFQPEVMDVYAAKEKYGNQLMFFGGISLQNVMAHGTPADCRNETLRLIETIGKGGGYIASPSHSITGDVPCENIAAVIETLEEQ